MVFHPFLQVKPAYLKLVYFIIIVACSLLLVNIFGLVLAVPFFGKSFIENLSSAPDYSDPLIIAQLKYLQVVNQLAIFIVPVLVFSMCAGKNISHYLKLSNKFKIFSLLIAAAIIILVLPLINLITEFNGNMSLPEQLGGVEKWMRDSEAEAAAVTNAFLDTATVGGFFINILMIAVLPAIGEEFFFRGVLQRLLGEWFKNVHVAVIVTAVIFSAFHLQFYGFLPRFLLGMFLGYIFYWSGSLWVPIIVHFINNGLAVVVAWLSARGMVDFNFETFGSSDNLFVIISSGVIVAGLMFVLFLSKKPEVRS
ncbi:MAG: CPBP family intramembrane metalloprotease [Bacteroidales bacterium]|jgi:hypothetical protein|nr:CPBP family intramembrane metalloprotease [Bacteroidales bacterium]MDD4215029.1 CPBP family intramembrane metalloprotease [Bacteroidales bacterium]